MSKKILTTPIRSEDLEDIRIGDIIYLNGYLITARDCAHTRLVKHGRKIPVDLAGKAIFHAGPIMVPIKVPAAALKSCPSVRPHPCAWKSSRKSSSKKPA